MTTASDIAELGTVLGVWAHPDDEAFLSSGLMLLARRSGNRVVCVTATGGEHGTDRPDQWPPERLAALRAREQRAALRELDVSEVIRLGYVDGSCADADPLGAARRIAGIVDAVRPGSVVTFGPDGMTGHPDHCTVSDWTTRALSFAHEQPRLLHATVTPDYAARQRTTNIQLGAFGPGLPVTTPADDLAVCVVLDDEALDRKTAALRAHASQTHLAERAVGAAAFRQWWQQESFVEASYRSLEPAVAARRTTPSPGS